MKPLLFMILMSLFAASSSSAFGQSSLADIKAKLAGRTSELDEVDKMLADPVKNNRIAAMQLLLASGNPVFARRAKETGLFSSDPEMQKAALSAILEGGGPFRIVLDLTTADEDKSEMKNWLRGHSGSWDDSGKVGQMTFTVNPLDAKKKCWTFHGSGYCAFVLAGTTVSLDQWHAAAGSLTLDGSGVLVGSLRNSGAAIAVPARIDLME